MPEGKQNFVAKIQHDVHRCRQNGPVITSELKKLDAIVAVEEMLTKISKGIKWNFSCIQISFRHGD